MIRKTARAKMFDVHGLILTGIVLVFIILGVTYSFVNPLFESPDEHWHFAFVKHLADHKELPVQPPGRYGHDAGQEASQPPLYYLIGALGTFWIDTADYKATLWANPHWAYDTMNRRNDNKNRYVHPPGQAWSFSGTALAARLMRWLSVMFGAVTVLCTYGIARETLPKREGLAPAAAALVAFTPQFIFVNSSVTNDSAVIALSSLYVLLLLRAVRRGTSLGGAAVLGLVLGLALLSKLSALMLVPITVIVLGTRAVWVVGWNKPAKYGRQLLLCLFLAGLTAGWWYARNWWLYGEPTGSEMMLEVFGRRQPTPGIIDMVAEFGLVQRTFWAAFGWGNVLVDELIYSAISLLLGLAGLGLAVGLAKVLWRRWAAKRNNTSELPEIYGDPAKAGLRSLPVAGLPARLANGLDVAGALSLSALALWFLLTFASLLRWMQSTIAPIGRLLFPTMAAISILILVGLGQLIPARTRNYVYGALVTGFLLFAAIAPFRYIAPAYAKPSTFDQAIQPPATYPRSITFGQAIELLGYDLSVENSPSRQPSGDSRLEPVIASPGDLLKLTVYWRPLAKIPKNYATFVHIVDPAGRSLGQRDTFAGLGNYPTGLWAPGVGLRDVYYVPVVAGADAPVLASLQLGLYDPETMERLPVTSSGKAIGDSPELARVKIVSRGPESSPPHGLATRFQNGAALEGYGLEMSQTKNGNRSTDGIQGSTESGERRLIVTLFWRSWQPIAKDYTVFAHLLTSDGRVVAQHDATPRNGVYPTSAWAAGEQIVDRHEVVLPPNLATNSFQIRVGIYDPMSGERASDIEGRLSDRSVSIEVPAELLAGR